MEHSVLLFYTQPETIGITSITRIALNLRKRWREQLAVSLVIHVIGLFTELSQRHDTGACHTRGQMCV